MIELLVLTWIIVGLIVKDYLNTKEARRERERLTNALIAKSAEEFRDLESAGETKGKPEPPRPQEPDLIPPSELPDDKFNKMIEEEIG